MDKKYGESSMIKINSALCKNINNVHLTLLYYGRAIVDNKWEGEVPTPIYSRLFYINSGSAIIETNDNQIITLEEGKWYLLPAGCSFKFYCKNQLDHIYFHFKLSDVDKIDFFNVCKRPCVVTYPKDLTEFLIKNLDNHSIKDGLKVRQTIYDILLFIIEQYNLDFNTKCLSPCVKNAIYYIKQHLSITLSLSKISENVYVSKSTLTKKFKKELSMSVHDYVRDIVLFEACQLLTKNNLSILAISEKLGFCDQFYFSRIFNEKFNMSPRQFRKLPSI